LTFDMNTVLSVSICTAFSMFTSVLLRQPCDSQKGY